ncbi:10951_t:CDS:2 [Entrophospora sp. SA101]|nr:1445_t:CDS:2 [Entrophospora sp. SA101]CAJ0908909.1 10951_t:CDS:2 [Entrophospora sp. SA101]
MVIIRLLVNGVGKKGSGRPQDMKLKNNQINISQPTTFNAMFSIATCCISLNFVNV